VAAFPNTGFMGVPLLVALLGARAAGPAIVTIMVDMVITTSLCIALSRLDSADAPTAWPCGKNALKGMLVNPMPWSILLGALASRCSFELPGPVARRWACWPTRPRPWRCSPSARCWRARRCAGAARPPRRAARLPAGGRDQAAAAPAAGVLVGAAAIALGCRWTGLR
jgi:hypothetical protein